MTADSVAQLYAARSGARYSLLSAVSQGGEVAVGVTLPEPGMYTFYIPETCDAGNYESVVLKDAKTGKRPICLMAAMTSLLLKAAIYRDALL